MREVSAKIYRALRDTGEGGHSYISVGTTIEFIMRP